MKVLVISSKFPNKIQYQHGMYVYELLRELANRCEVRVVSPISLTPPIALLKKAVHRPAVMKKYYGELRRIPKFDYYYGIPVRYVKLVYLPKKIAQFTEGIILLLRLFPVLFSLRRQFKFDLIHAHFAFPEGFAAALLGKIFGVPVVIHCQGSDINVDLGKSFILTQLIVYGLLNASYVFTVSNEIRNRIFQTINLNGTLQVLPNGVNLKKFFPIDKIRARKKLGLPLDKNLLLFVGNLFSVKGVNYLIDAMEQIAMQHPDILLYIVGEGILKDPLMRKVKKLGLEHRVFFTGNIPHDEIPNWMNAVNLFILPSINEGWPTVLPEALACGTPVVASRVGGIPEMIDSEKVGLLANPRDPNDLREKIIYGLAKTWNQNYLVSRAKQCSWQKIADEVYHVYENLLY